MRRVSRYVQRLLRDRSPRPFVPTDEEAEALRAGIALRGGLPEASLPDPRFVARLRDRLGGETVEPARHGRRGVLVGAAAASAAIAVAADRAVVAITSTTAEPAATLSPESGIWQPVLAAAELGDGEVRHFDTGTVTGFVMRTGGVLSARSGVCTHQGCRLAFNSAARRLDCPCHKTAFGLDGHVLRYALAKPPATLPAISVREADGQIQVLVPPG